ncbi:MAG: Crp/Fnr family transcriptional regulator [Acidimicrobiales bacterium]|nr:Crp/Fnr family transcriptional regulator [Acidimicrobiales bacterium]
MRNTDLFRELETDLLERLTRHAVQRRIHRGDVLFDEGEQANELFIVASGRIAIANKSPDGRESVVALMEAGDLFGEMPLFDGQGRSAEARALTTAEIVSVPYAPIKTLYDEKPELLWGVVGMLARRLRATDEALADSVFLDVTGRTAKRLLEMAGDADEFVLPVTQEELAGMVGASRERVNKAIASFIRLGWIEQGDRKYIITDREQLSRRAR